MSEVRNENYEGVENNAMDNQNYESESSGGGLAAKIVAGIGIGLVGAGIAYYHKTKDKREAKQVDKLKKKGYTVLKPRVPDEDDFEEEVETEETPKEEKPAKKEEKKTK